METESRHSPLQPPSSKPRLRGGVFFCPGSIGVVGQVSGGKLLRTGLLLPGESITRPAFPGRQGPPLGALALQGRRALAAEAADEPEVLPLLPGRQDGAARDDALDQRLLEATVKAG